MSQTGKNPNAVDLPRSDAKCSTGGCSQMKQKLQLIPLRYGLVERLDPSSELSLPYKTVSRPMGIRLLRDGWLYIIDNTTGYLHEYEVKNGIVTKCIWKGKEATQDKRTGSAGENALVFTRGSSLHIAYAEVQWTAAKCSQMLKSSKERDLFMQKVNLSKGDVEKGGPHLLTDKQAEKWIAEVAEKPATQAPPAGAHPEESKDYIWEDQKDLFKSAQLGTLKKSLLAAYEKDHFFLVFKDSIGVMRDLAEQQDKVVGWIDEWVLKEKNDLKYSIGNYIETLMVVSDNSARQAGTSDALFEKTSPEQRQKIYDYVNSRNEYDGARTNTTDLPQRVSRVRVPNPKVGAAYKVMNNKKQEMIDSLGKSLYSDLEDDIEVLEDKSHAAVQGKGLGARGIHDLVRYKEMNNYLETERSHMKRWTSRLNRITDDRVGLFTKSEYHMSAWYFDADVPDQLKSALVTEQNCVRDLCRTEDSLKLVGEYLHGAPYYSLPAFASHLNLEFFLKKKGDLLKWLDDGRNLRGGLDDAKARADAMGAFTGRYWATNLTPDALSLSHAISAAYSPAVALRLQNWLSDLQEKLNGAELNSHLDKFSTHTNRAHRLATHNALQNAGITPKVATAQDKQFFLERMGRLGKILETEDQLIRDRNRAQKESKRRVPSSDEQAQARQTAAKSEKIELNRQLFMLRKERQALSAQIQESIVTTNTLTTGYVGVRLTLETPQQTLLNNEIAKLKQGALRGYGEPGAGLSAFKSGVIPMAALFFQVRNLGDAIETWKNIPGSKSLKEQVVGIGAFTGATAAALSVYQNAHISVADKGFRAITTSSAGKSGGLFAAKLGRLGLGLGVVIAPLTLIGSVGTSWDNWDKWTDALLTGTAGEKAGALMALTGDVGNTGIAVATTVRGFWDIGVIGRTYVTAAPSQRAAAIGYVWGTRGVRFLSFSARLTPWSLGLTALQLGGEALFNYFNLDDQQRWMLSCCWGNENKQWDMPKHAQALAEVNLRPVITDVGIVKRQLDGTSVRALTFDFPGVSFERLNKTPLRVQAELSAQLTRPAVDVGEYIRDNFQLASINPMKLQLEIPEDWCGEQSQLKLRLSIQPDLAAAPLKAEDNYLFYPVSLRFSGINKPLRGDSSIKPNQTPLKWVDVKPEHLHA